MATKTSIVSDLSGEPDATTFQFAAQSTAYEIDLTAEERATFLRLLEPYITNGRSYKIQTVRPTRHGGTNEDKRNLAHIREWAHMQGFTVNARGRIPSAVVQAYRDAHL